PAGVGRPTTRLAALLAAALLGSAARPAAAAPQRPAPTPNAQSPTPKAPTGEPVRLTIHPDKITLSGRSSWQRFLVFGHYADGRVRDLTAGAKASKTGGAGLPVEGNRI